MNAEWDQFGSDPGGAGGVPSPGRRGDDARASGAPDPPSFPDLDADPTFYPSDTSGSFVWSPPEGRESDEIEPARPLRDRTPAARPAATAPPPPAPRPPVDAPRDLEETTPIPHATPAPSNAISKGSSGSIPSANYFSDDAIEFVENPEPGMEFDGSYRFIREIGKGGMGSVWEVTHLGFNSPRALKLIVSKYVSDRQVRKRFVREAQIMGRLRHPHAVTVHNFKVSRERAYIEMELLKGQPLNRVVAAGRRLPVGLVGRLVDQLCDVLQAAHDEGIIHRDLKPANLFLLDREPGREFLKVLDFGIAKLEQPDSVDGVEEEALTTLGSFLGTVHYASPEQIHGNRIDHRSDLYSVGVILFELLTGQRPFSGTSMQIRIHHINSPVPGFESVAPGCGVPPEVEEVVRRCLAKSPEDRFGSAREIAEAFRAALGRAGNPATEPTARTGQGSGTLPAVEPGSGAIRTTQAGSRTDLRSRPPSHADGLATSFKPETGVSSRLADGHEADGFDLLSDPGGRPIDPRDIAGDHADSLCGVGGEPRPAPDAATGTPPAPKPPGRAGLILGAVALVSLGVGLAVIVPKFLGGRTGPEIAGTGPDGGTVAGQGRPTPVKPPAPKTPAAAVPDGFELVEGEEEVEGSLPKRIRRVLRPASPDGRAVEVTFVLLPGRIFAMGSDDPAIRKRIDTEKLKEEYPSPVHRVKLSSFYMMETEVTNNQMEVYFQATNRQTESERPTFWRERKESLENPGDHPAVGLTWEEARGFARWVAPGGDLPTEAQWEYAARSLGEDRMFVLDREPRFEDAQIGVRAGDARNPTTVPVRLVEKDRTLQGIYGMIGNVREWCRDVLCAYTASGEPAPDPCPGEDDPNLLSPFRHVIRGGSYCSTSQSFSTYGPRYPRPGYDIQTVDQLKNRQAADDVGFRVVIEVPR